MKPTRPTTFGNEPQTLVNPRPESRRKHRPGQNKATHSKRKVSKVTQIHHLKLKTTEPGARYLGPGVWNEHLAVTFDFCWLEKLWAIFAEN